VLATVKPDVALNVLHGRPGEDGTLQGMLEISASLQPFRRARLGAGDAEGRGQESVAPPACRCRGHGGVALRARQAHLLPPPYVIKPIAEGSSVGFSS
jgi:D-alanine-D-alanine ligase